MKIITKFWELVLYINIDCKLESQYQYKIYIFEKTF